MILPKPGILASGVIFLILSYIRTIILYLILIFVIRMMGKRQIGEMEPSEFVVTMLVANLASIPMQDGAIPLFSGLVPILTVLGVELVISWLTMSSVAARRLFCGKPVILIDGGQISGENLRRTRITVDELMGHLRQKDILNPADVEFAVLETNGELSVFPYPSHRPATAQEAGVKVNRQYLPVTLIENGRILRENLSIAGKNTAWIQKTLAERNTTQKQTLLLTVDDAGHICLFCREETA